MRQQLKSETKQLHDEIEELMYVKEIMAGKLTKEQLMALLFINHRYFNEVESLLAKSIYQCEFSIHKTHLTQYDLRETEWSENNDLATKDATLHRALHLNAESKEDVLGTLYVALGSSLGSQMIAKKLATIPDLETSSYTFYTDSKETMPMWRKFLQVLDAEAESADRDKIIEAAKRNFGLIKELATELQLT